MIHWDSTTAMPSPHDDMGHRKVGRDSIEAGPEFEDLSEGGDVGQNGLPGGDARGDAADTALCDTDASSGDLEKQGDEVCPFGVPPAHLAELRSRALRYAGERLRAARQAAGYASGSDFAREVRMPISTYNSYENGSRIISADSERIFAHHLKVAIGTIRYGSELPLIRDVPILGRLGEQVANKGNGMFDGIESHRTIDLTSLVGHLITELSVDGFDVNDVALHERLDPDKLDLDSLHGKVCVVEMADGTMRLRRVVAQRNGLASLFGDHVEPMLDVQLVAASRVRMVDKNH